MEAGRGNIATRLQARQIAGFVEDAEPRRVHFWFPLYAAFAASAGLAEGLPRSRLRAGSSTNL